MKRKIKIVDSPMGTGKTMGAIDHINQLPEDVNVLFVTPFLTECDRIIASCPSKNFKQPDPTKCKTKARHLKQLLKKGKNVVCTHSLFSAIDDGLIAALRRKNYILILDEVMDVISPYSMGDDVDAKRKSEGTKIDMATLIKRGCIEIDPDYKVRWIDDKSTRLTKYRDVKNLADRNLLYYINDSVLLWIFPPEIFEEDVFTGIYLLTYLFDYQIQSHYYEFYGLPYELYHVDNSSGFHKFVKTTDRKYESEWKESVKDLINICESDRRNDVGRLYAGKNGADVCSALSSNWYANNKDSYGDIKNNTYGFFRKVPPSNRMFTVFKRYRDSVKTKYVSNKAFVPINSKATNMYGDRTHCAYLVNRYVNPFIYAMLLTRGVTMDQDKFALAEMVQWIWRSAIRNGHPINLYIPSYRMRILLKKWLNDEQIKFVPYKSKWLTPKRNR